MKQENLLTRLKGYENSQCFKLFLKLFKQDIEALRLKNDSAPVEDVPKNQGAIQWLKKRLKDLEPTEPPKIYDGGYGD